MAADAPTKDDVSKPVGESIEGNKFFLIFQHLFSYLKISMGAYNVVTSDTKKLIHCIKFGIALIIVSLIYTVNPMFNKVGDDAMWAIMTVVVMFEFYAGAAVWKGINRIIGTVVGAVLGLLVAILGGEIGGIAKPIIITSSIFIFGGIATYFRQVPRLKQKYDYGFMVFILTLSLVAVSGERVDKVVQLGQDRITDIGMGFVVSIFISFFICPIWASNDLHTSIASKFD